MPYRSLLLLLIVSHLSAAVTEASSFAPTIKLPDGQKPVDLSHYALSVRVHGLYAECTACMTFHNSNGIQLEGTLEFPLPDHATVSGYALDINNHLVEGVVVGKDQARVVLEDERRRRVDPGLVELVRGNLFRTRIWPIPAMGLRTVSVTWVQELAVRGDEAALRIALPHTILQNLKLHIEIASGSAVPQIGGFGNLSLTTWKDMRVADASLFDITPSDDLLVRLPSLPRQLIQVEDGTEERFVAISERAELPAAPAAEPPSRIAVAWDASGSRTPDSIARSRQFLQTLLRRYPHCGIDLVVIRDIPEAVRSYRDAISVLAAIDHLPYDGGTALSRLDLRRAALPQPDDRCWVLISDGLSTIGHGLPANGDIPVFCVTSDAERDTSYLRLLAARTGGALVDLLAQDADGAVTAVVSPTAGLMRVDATSDVLGDIQTSYAAGRATVLARLHGAGAVDLVYGSAGRETFRSHIQVTTTGSVTGGVLARAWAGEHAADLGVFAEENQTELIALGQRYHLVTPGTSLLVLERLDQYIRHGIAPPATSPEMRDAYYTWQKNHANMWQSGDRDHLEQVVSWWQMRVAWWERTSLPPQAGILAREQVLPPSNPGAPMPTTPRARGLAGNSAAAAPLVPPASVDGADQVVSALTSAEPAEEERDEARSPVVARFGAVAGGGETLRQAPSSPSAVVAGRTADSGISSSISITPFDPTTPYLRALNEAPADSVYTTYLRERDSWKASPAFYLDCAGFFFARNAALGHRILSNLAEMRIDDPSLLRVFAWRLHEAGDLDLAVDVLRHVLHLRPEEPQSYRDLALVLAARGEAKGHGPDLSEAMDLLYRVVMRHPLEGVNLGERTEFMQAWNRFPQIEVIALEELNRLLTLSWRRTGDQATVSPPLDPRLVKSMDCDLRVVMSWDADATDIDLHVVEPSGEEAYYGHQLTSCGGLVSSDMVSGYGPEEYLLRKASSGTYRIRCHYFGANGANLMGPTTVTAIAITNWGRPSEQRRMLTLRLNTRGDLIAVGDIALGSGAGESSPSLQTEAATVTIEQIKTLTVGQHRTEVEAKLGLPMRVDGNGVMVLVYKTSTGALSRLGFGPDLMWAREVLDGAERDLLVH